MQLSKELKQVKWDSICDELDLIPFFSAPLSKTDKMRLLELRVEAEQLVKGELIVKTYKKTSKT